MFPSYTLHFALRGAQRELAVFKDKSDSLVVLLAGGPWRTMPAQRPTRLDAGGTHNVSGCVKSWMSRCFQKSVSKLKNG